MKKIKISYLLGKYGFKTRPNSNRWFYYTNTHCVVCYGNEEVKCELNEISVRKGIVKIEQFHIERLENERDNKPI